MLLGSLRSVFFGHLVSPLTPSCFCFARRRLHPSRDLLGGGRLRQAVRTSAALRRRQTHGRKLKKKHSPSFPSLLPVFVLCWSAVSKHIHAKPSRQLMEIKRNKLTPWETNTPALWGIMFTHANTKPGDIYWHNGCMKAKLGCWEMGKTFQWE